MCWVGENIVGNVKWDNVRLQRLSSFPYDRITINEFWRIVYLLPGNRLIKAFGSGDRLAMTRNRARFWMVIDCFVSNNDHPELTSY